jgi:alkylation response protein AidB-like acyl-CoA dehydrogenase
LFEEVGRTLAPVQLLPTLAMGAAAIVAHGSDEQKERFLRPVAEGALVLTAAIHEGPGSDPFAPAVEATVVGDGLQLSGTKIFVPAARVAGGMLVTAAVQGELVLVVVDPACAGVSLVEHETTSGEYEYDVTLEGVSVTGADVIGRGDGARAALQTLLNWTTAGLCAMELGVADRAVRMAASYTSERKQFGKPIGSFQAVAQRVGDAYIDVAAQRLTTWQAAWLLDQGLPATRELSIAKFWAAEGGHRACYAAQHVHGGMGVDKDYPLHRYYMESRRLELTLGGANTHLAELGRRMAES